ncbi:MAG: hypothetical protein LC649_10675 [Bacteroidales bacterium]|nr:hypothetical protein [Bacteroidales bacterium]
MKNIFVNRKDFWFRNSSIGYLMILTIILSVSCENEYSGQSDFIQSFRLSKPQFIGGIESYDKSGARIEYLSSHYIQNDFLFIDEGNSRYKEIKIKTDSTVLFYYTLKGATYFDTGKVKSSKNTLYFYHDAMDADEPLFKGLISRDGKLSLPAYGYKMCFTKTSGSGSIGTAAYGTPNLNSLVDLLNGMGDEDYDRILVQRFDLNYVDVN